MGMQYLIFTLIVFELILTAFCPAMEDNQDTCDFPKYERTGGYFAAIILKEDNFSDNVTFPTDMAPDNIAFNGEILSSCLISFENATELFKKQNYVEAISYLNETIRICPDYADAWYNRGYNKFQLKLFREALEDFNMAIELNPKDAEYWAFKGITLIKLKKNIEALAALNNSISINPDIPYTQKYKFQILSAVNI
jgi:tetratricopeptide (TPR) repeat protein